MILDTELKEYVRANPKLVTMRQSLRYPSLFVVKYTRKVFYDNLWTPELEECRGLVVDQNWNIVVRPFRKIYNRGENGTDFKLDDKVVAVRKINGFMAAATYDDPIGGVVVSTTGSLDSPFVAMAEKYLRPYVDKWIKTLGRGLTWLFEICDPEDPHIIKESPGVYLIGARFVGNGRMLSEKSLDDYAKSMGVLRPFHYSKMSFNTILDLVKNCNHEGFVVHHDDGRSLKIKSPYYLITKFLARKKDEKLVDLLSDIPSLRKTVDEEFYPLLDYLETNVDFPSMNEQQRISVITDFLKEMK